MANVLLAWELGMGLWHTRLLRTIGRGLQAEGHSVTYAMANPVQSWRLLRDESATVLQAPVATPRIRNVNDEFRAGTFADILYEAGFHTPHSLASLVGVWDGVIDVVRPDLVVCDHAPSLLVACHDRLPVVQVGLGFTQPPAELSPFPSLIPGQEGSPLEADCLNSVNAVLEARGVRSIGMLGTLYANSVSHVTTFAEFDPYSGHRKGPFVGPLDDLPKPLGPPQDEGYFAYLSADVPEAIDFLRLLASSGCRGKVYLRGAHPSVRENLRALGLCLLDEPANMVEALEKSSLLIHHGGVGSAEQAASAGRPQLLLPWHLEQAYNAAVLSEIGLGRVVERGEACGEQVRAMSGSPAITNRVRAFAELAAARKNGQALDLGLASCRPHL